MSSTSLPPSSSPSPQQIPFHQDIELGGNELKEARFEVLPEFPPSPKLGQSFTYKPPAAAVGVVYYWTGSAWQRTDAVVRSVAGRIGDVVLAKSDVGLSLVDDTSDVNKPISAAASTALANKQPLNAHLTSISSLNPANDDVIQLKSGSFVNRTLTQLKSDLNLLPDTAYVLNAETANRAAADSQLQNDINTKVNRSGDTMSGNLSTPSQIIGDKKRQVMKAKEESAKSKSQKPPTGT